VLVEDVLAAAHDVPDALAEAEGDDSELLSPLTTALVLSLARNAAIPDGQLLSADDMERLVNALFACSDVKFTPDGKRIIALLEQKSIEALF